MNKILKFARNIYIYIRTQGIQGFLKKGGCYLYNILLSFYGKEVYACNSQGTPRDYNG